MKTKIYISLLLTTIIFLSSLGLVFAPSINEIDLKREKREFSLDVNENYYLFNTTVTNINKIVVILTDGRGFQVRYIPISDTPVQPIIENYAASHTFLLSGVRFFTIKNPLTHIEGIIEIDYTPLTPIS